ncbi:hypothetical protein [Cellvibrio sp. UBA7661]|uniref:hypothetical protein n=1 Tax=Cellvibrio sp. UBA7661 TaxID=1946311 RepID=UPI002F352AE3
MQYTSALVTGEPSGQLTGTASRGKTGGGLEAIQYGLQCRALTGLSVERIFYWEVPGNATTIVIHLNEFKHPFVTFKGVGKIDKSAGGFIWPGWGQQAWQDFSGHLLQ